VDDQQQAPRRPTRRQLLWAGGIVAVLTVAVLIGYRYGITLWDWLQLLIIPAVLAGGGIWFNRRQQELSQESQDQRAQDEALQAYLDHVSQLMGDKDRPLHRALSGDPLSTVARARTLSVLPRLDGSRKRSVVQFMYESGLVTSQPIPWKPYPGGPPPYGPGGSRPYQASVVSLAGADLSSAHLSNATLVGAKLNETDLNSANLSGADLSDADLSSARLSSAVLRDAHLTYANLREADLSSANLSGADLSGADLKGARELTDEQLAQAESLEYATMPNGQKYEEWLKSKGPGEDGENSGPS
jgi:uncharacterized protein YjbI with pentapeptide repeats